MITRPIPSSGEALPVLGIGTYDVFDHASTPDAVANSREIVDILLGEGGSVIDHGQGTLRERDALIDVDCDVWIPAARPDVINDDNVERLRARVAAAVRAV